MIKMYVIYWRKIVKSYYGKWVLVGCLFVYVYIYLVNSYWLFETYLGNIWGFLCTLIVFFVYCFLFKDLVLYSV